MAEMIPPATTVGNPLNKPDTSLSWRLHLGIMIQLLVAAGWSGMDGLKSRKWAKEN